LDTIVFTFKSPQIAALYFEGEQSMAYTYSRSQDVFMITIHVDDNLGSLWGASRLNFIVSTTNSDRNDFLFNAVI
jgi:hypothetical protein